MATSTGQRVGIWVIAVVLLIGSVGAYFLAIVANDNQAKQATEQQKMIDELTKQQEEANKMPKEPLPGYNASTFDAASVATLVKEDLKVGDGAEATATSTVRANYMGWLADGTIFDSSVSGGVASPIEFPLSGVISGWSEGVPGMKVGGVRKLTIPAAQAYGAQAVGKIPANSPLVFIVELIEVK